MSLSDRTLRSSWSLIQALLMALDQVVELSFDSFLILFKEGNSQVVVVIVRLSLKSPLIVPGVPLGLDVLLNGDL